MSDIALTTDLPRIAALQPAQPATLERSAPGKVTGRLKAAIDAMVWLGLKRAAAAEHANLKEHSLYVAFTRPHVKAYYLAQLEVLRTSERARNIHRLTEIRDKADNMPAVNAIKMLEQLGDTDGPGTTARQSAGLVIVINGAATQEPRAPNPVQVIDNTESET